MKRADIAEIISQSAKLEEAVSKIYLSFARRYPDDCDFWMQLYVDEKIHSAVFLMLQGSEVNPEKLPPSFFVSSLTDVQRANDFLALELEKVRSGAYDRKAAYDLALRIEDLAVELTYQDAMQKTDAAPELFLLQRINRDSVNHRQRIAELIRGKNWR